MWGWPIVRQLDTERFEGLKTHGELMCVEKGKWALVKARLTDVDAIAKYGKRGAIERGPRGGFVAVTYGATRFTSRYMRPPGF
jgi:hypothetical protein